MNNTVLFISHANEDSNVVGPIVQYLEARGVGCWISSRDIPPRSIYAEAITRAMQDAGACAVIVSDSANQSDAIKRELELASHYRKPFIPIRVDATEPGPGLDYYLRNTQWIDYHGERERGLDRIVTHMKAGPAPARAPSAYAAPSPAMSAAPRQAGNPMPMVIAAAVLAAAAAGGWYLFGRAQPGTTEIAANDAATDLAAPPAPIIEPGAGDGATRAEIERLQEEMARLTQERDAAAAAAQDRLRELDSSRRSEAATPAPTVRVNGMWDLSVRCSNGAVMGEPQARFTGGEYYRRWGNGTTSGETRLVMTSGDANSLRTLGQVSFDGGAVYPVDARATGNGTSFSGTASFGDNTNCPFTATRTSD